MAGQNQTDKAWARKTGIFLVILSCIFYVGLLLVPFSPYTVGTKAAVSTTLIILGEASFWIGGLILCKELVTQYRKYLNPIRWFKRKANK